MRQGVSEATDKPKGRLDPRLKSSDGGVKRRYIVPFAYIESIKRRKRARIAATREIVFPLRGQGRSRFLWTHSDAERKEILILSSI